MTIAEDENVAAIITAFAMLKFIVSRPLQLPMPTELADGNARQRWLSSSAGIYSMP